MRTRTQMPSSELESECRPRTEVRPTQLVHLQVPDRAEVRQPIAQLDDVIDQRREQALSRPISAPVAASPMTTKNLGAQAGVSQPAREREAPARERSRLVEGDQGRASERLERRAALEQGPALRRLPERRGYGQRREAACGADVPCHSTGQKLTREPHALAIFTSGTRRSPDSVSARPRAMSVAGACCGRSRTKMGTAGGTCARLTAC